MRIPLCLFRSDVHFHHCPDDIFFCLFHVTNPGTTPHWSFSYAAFVLPHPCHVTTGLVVQCPSSWSHSHNSTKWHQWNGLRLLLFALYRDPIQLHLSLNGVNILLFCLFTSPLNSWHRTPCLCLPNLPCPVSPMHGQIRDSPLFPVDISNPVGPLYQGCRALPFSMIIHFPRHITVLVGGTSSSLSCSHHPPCTYGITKVMMQRYYSLHRWYLLASCTSDASTLRHIWTVCSMTSQHRYCPNGVVLVLFAMFTSPCHYTSLVGWDCPLVLVKSHLQPHPFADGMELLLLSADHWNHIADDEYQLSLVIFSFCLLTPTTLVIITYCSLHFHLLCPFTLLQ